jgi:hypothetical protein
MIETGGAAIPSPDELAERLRATADLARVIVWPILLSLFMIFWRRTVLKMFACLIRLIASVIRLIDRVKTVKVSGAELECLTLPPEKVGSPPRGAREHPFLL